MTATSSLYGNHLVLLSLLSNWTPRCILLHQANDIMPKGGETALLRSHAFPVLSWVAFA